MPLKVNLTQLRHESDRLLSICRYPDDEVKMMEEAIYAYVSLYDQDFLKEIKLYYHDDANALKWVDFFEIDLKQLRIDVVAINFSTITKVHLQRLKKSVIELLVAQQEYLFPLLERVKS